MQQGAEIPKHRQTCGSAQTARAEVTNTDKKDHISAAGIHTNLAIARKTQLLDTARV